MMLKNLGKFLIIGVCFIATSCSKDKIPLEGERISIMQTKNSIKPDANAENIKIVLPQVEVNNAWAQSGGNSQHVMGHVATAKEIKEIWRSKFGKGSSKRDMLIAEPVSVHDAVFTIDADAIVRAFRLDNGKEIWKRRLKPAVKSDKEISLKGAGLAARDKTLFATTGFGGVFAMDVVTGNILWNHTTETPIRIAPTVGTDRLFVQTIDNLLIALDTATGKELWKYKVNLEATTLVGGASPAYSQALDVVVAAFSNGEVRAFKASTGSPLWADYLVAKRRVNSLANINAIKANPVIDGDRVYVAGNNSIFAAINIRTGERVWEKEIGMTNQPWVAGNYIFGLSDNFDLFAMEKNTGKIIWSFNVPTATNIEDKSGVFVSGPVLTGNRLIVATSNGYAFAVSPYVGKILGFVQVDEGVVLPPIVVNEMLILTSNDARLLAYK